MNLKTFLLSSLSIFSANAAAALPTLDLPWGSYQAKVLPADKQVHGDPSQDLDPDGSDTTAVSAWSGTEDCLFLDIYVPKSVFDNPSSPPLPVTVWFYGGAYAFGTKRMSTGPLYNGRSLIKASNYKTIFVAGNYRLGAFGWLAGSIMEANGLPNAGLYDQNLLLQWVQKYIGLVHGDNTNVSAWGESAGGGSILHHLIRDNGTKDPLFTRFVTQSPAFEWAWNNSAGGQLDQVYKNFSSSLGCPAPYDIECIRNPSIPLKTLAEANVKLFDSVKQTGLFPIGPSVDNSWIKTIPTLAFAKGKFWPDSPDLRTKIAGQYNCTRDYNGDYNLCLRHVIRDSSFTCNTRDLLDAYPKQAYAMNYGFPDDNLAYHATDLVPLFANVEIPGQIMTMFIVAFKYPLLKARELAIQLREKIIPVYLQYLSSFAVYGNTGDKGWPVVARSEKGFSNVMKPSSGGWNLVQDEQNTQEICNFWRDRAHDLMSQPANMGSKNEGLKWDAEVQEEL
ncbi:cholinesterase [Fusarium beomiforme]|uniref:Cholinesterase n=1 Tax=Fusarium beomiforme TaxID=44412 RepID=A0A9P5E208_9HYPO|nr:cholinesterase [Fusarium beomiforme]